MAKKVQPDTAFELQGQWWLPESPEVRVHGLFTWDPSTGGRLDLVGRLEPDSEDDRPEGQSRVADLLGRGEYAVVHGETPDGHFTLLDAVSNGATMRFFGSFPTSQTLRVNSAIFGDALFDQMEQPLFTGISFALRNLTAWVGQGGFEPTVHMPPGSGVEAITVTIERKTNMSSRTSAGLAIDLCHQVWEHRASAESYELHQRWLMSLTPDGTATLRELLDLAVDAQQLLTIATGSTADITLTYLYFDAPDDGTSSSLLYFAVWQNRSDPAKRREPRRLNFNLNDLGGVDGIARWMEVAADYRSEVSRIMATRHNKALSLQDRILAMCAALESFDKERRQTGKKKVDYLDRVRECIAWAGPMFTKSITGDTDEWAKSIRDIRNDLAHHRPAVRRNETQASRTLDLQLFWLLAIGLLRLAGAPDSLLEHHREPEDAEPRAVVVKESRPSRAVTSERSGETSDGE